MKRFLLLTKQAGAPRSCEECRDLRYHEGEIVSDENDGDIDAEDWGCWYGACPYDAMSANERLLDLYDFCMTSLGSWEEEDPVTKRKSRKYAVEIDKFEFACRNHGIETKEDRQEYYRWAAYVARLCTEAPDNHLEAEAIRIELRNGGLLFEDIEGEGEGNLGLTGEGDLDG